MIPDEMANDEKQVETGLQSLRMDLLELLEPVERHHNVHQRARELENGEPWKLEERLAPVTLVERDLGPLQGALHLDVVDDDDDGQALDLHVPWPLELETDYP